MHTPTPTNAQIREQLSRRQRDILSLVEEQGFVATEQLVDAFGVTPQTIRRDINQLCDKRLLQRFHGGAGRPTSTENEPYPERRRAFQASKKKIGELVAQSIPDGASLFINIGTTTEAVSEALLRRQNLRVVTNNLNVARILSANPSFEILIAGGELRARDGGIVGQTAANFVSQFRLDFGIIGVSGIERDGSLLDFDARETEISQLIMQHSERLFLVADQSKFGRRAMIRFGSITDIDELYTDAPPAEPYLSALHSGNVTIQIAEE